MPITQNMQRDGGYAPIQSNHAMLVTKTITFDGATENDPGDFDGTGNPATIFTVTGTVLLSVFAVVGTNLTGADATVSVGTATTTDLWAGPNTGTDLDAGQSWVGTDHLVGCTLPDTLVLHDADIIQTVGTANVTGGSITYYCLYRPLSVGASVVAA